ncbi:hypothetical protein EfmJHP38_34240 (plasmid) [Enterococcus faecium]|nr:hypothetical protein EfmJHP38_34240 [Enterococcus faecium]
MTRKNLLFGSILLGILGFSPMLLSVINKGNKHGELKLNPNNKGNKHGELKLNPNYYNSPNEELFVKETDK